MEPITWLAGYAETVLFTEVTQVPRCCLTLGKTMPLPPLLVIIRTLTSTFPFTFETLTGIHLYSTQTCSLCKVLPSHADVLRLSETRSNGQATSICYIPGNQSCTILAVTLHFPALAGMQGLWPSNQTCGHDASDEVA